MRLLGFAVLAACSCPPAATTPKAVAQTRSFDTLSSATLDHMFQANPSEAISLGLHDYDGRLPDRTPDGLAAELAMLRTDRTALEATDPATLSELQREERGTLLQGIRGRLFETVDLDQFHSNPMSYTDAIDLDAFVIRDYAPVAKRAAAVIALCRGVPAYLARARSNLKTPIPRPWIDTALLQTKGLAEFADHDVRQALAGQPELDAALDTCKTALTEHATWLEQQQPQGTSDYALGATKFLAMLSETQGITTDLATLTRLAQADLARNTAAIEEAARAIDATKPTAEVVAAIDADKPEDVLAEATRQAAEMRAFLIDHHIVGVPGDDVAKVRASPPFQRWNQAFMNGPGPFETVTLPSFYYISPPDPTWTPEVQRGYIPSRNDLLFVTIHEVYPGHFVHGIHLRRNPSRVLRSLWSYATGEGWAHYTEEMMYDAGAGGHTPQAHIAQLEEALLRDVRFVVAIGEHTGGMTVDAAETLFRTRAFLDQGNARQQAMRGTFDPMFLSYTLGKLVIRKLHTDWAAKHPDATLGDFHDAFLSFGAAPLSVIRRALVGDDALL